MNLVFDMSFEILGQSRAGLDSAKIGEEIASIALGGSLMDIAIDVNRFSSKPANNTKSPDFFVRFPFVHLGQSAKSFSKRALDFSIALLGIVFLLPFFTIISLLIVIDNPGNPIFTQTRTGLNGKKFKIWKFRTMKVRECGSNLTQAQRNDARITRIGAFLRQTSIDELPQLVNVLVGEMSLIGPRPHAIAHDIHFGSLINEYCGRFRVKPGITGLAQISGARGPTPSVQVMEKRVNYDLEYIENWSIGLDVKIFFKTLTSFAFHDAF